MIARRNDINHRIRFLLLFVLIHYASDAYADNLSVVGVPFVFSAERDKILTTACLSVNQRYYEALSASLNGQPSSVENSLGLLLRAMADGNEAVLRTLIDTGQNNQKQNVDTQIKAYLEQFKHVRALGAKHAFIFNNLVVFFVIFEKKSGGGRVVSPFVFLNQPSMGYKFLPDRPSSVVLELLQQWYDSEWGPKLDVQARYCGSSEMRSATYRIPLSSVPSDSTTALFFNGFAATEISGGELLKSVKNSVSQLVLLANSGSVDSLKAIISNSSWSRVSLIKGTEWEASYLQDLVKLSPRFVINLGSVAVVYSTTGSSGIRTGYLIQEGKNWKWTNVRLMNLSSKVFEAKEMLDATTANLPFAAFQQSKASH